MTERRNSSNRKDTIDGGSVSNLQKSAMGKDIDLPSRRKSLDGENANHFLNIGGLHIQHTDDNKTKSFMQKSKSEGNFSNSDLELLSLLTPDLQYLSTAVRHNTMSILPIGFKKEIQQRLMDGRISESVAKYYLEVLPQGDSRRFPGQNGRPRLLSGILTENVKRLTSDSAKGNDWRPRRVIGKGAYGSVLLWEKTSADGLSIRLAAKDSECSRFFRDYCSEAHLTRRLNDQGCKNVINVVEWMHIKERIYQTPNGVTHEGNPRNRICYEYAAYGDLQSLELWYELKHLIFPEAFI